MSMTFVFFPVTVTNSVIRTPPKAIGVRLGPLEFETIRGDSRKTISFQMPTVTDTGEDGTINPIPSGRTQPKHWPSSVPT